MLISVSARSIISDEEASFRLHNADRMKAAASSSARTSMTAEEQILRQLFKDAKVAQGIE